MAEPIAQREPKVCEKARSRTFLSRHQTRIIILLRRRTAIFLPALHFFCTIDQSIAEARSCRICVEHRTTSATN